MLFVSAIFLFFFLFLPVFANSFASYFPSILSFHPYFTARTICAFDSNLYHTSDIIKECLCILLCIDADDSDGEYGHLNVCPCIAVMYMVFWCKHNAVLHGVSVRMHNTQLNILTENTMQPTQTNRPNKNRVLFNYIQAKFISSCAII